MQKLSNISEDTHAKKVLSALQESISNAKNNPLLRKMLTGSLPLRAFGFVAKVRLNAATEFIPFLRAAEEKLRQDEGWSDMATALKGNLNEELGLIQGTYHIEADHDEWRTRFRSGLERVLHAKGISLQEIDDEDTVKDIGNYYGKKLQAMAAEKSSAALAGAFTVLEGILENEFAAMLTFIKSRLDDMTAQEILYVSHHANHEHRHFEESAIPLLKKCALTPHVVTEVIEGIRKMEKLRMQEVLERTDGDLWKSEEKK